MSSDVPEGYTLDDIPEGFVLDSLGMQTKTPDPRTAYQQAARKATSAVEQQLGPLAGAAAQFVIPQNEAEIGMLGGLLGAQGLVAKSGLSGLKAAGTRIAGGAIGGEVGGQLGGQEPGTGAALGATAGVTGEIATPAFGWAMRSAPGMKQFINRQRSAEIGKVIESRVPPLAGARDPGALDQMARDFEQGKGALFDYYGTIKSNFERRLGTNRLKIPELVDPANAATAASIRQQIATNQGQYTPQHIAAMRQQADQLESVPITDVWDELKKTGHYGFGAPKSDPNVRTIVGQEPRVAYRQLIDKTMRELDRIDPTHSLSTDFEANRKMAASGFTFLTMLNKSPAFLRYPKNVQLNIPWIQEYVNQHQSEIKQRIGTEAFDKLKSVLWRGGKMGTRDLPAIGAGNVEDAAMEAMRGVGGSPRIISAPLRTLMPSLGAQYAGTPPFSPSGGTRTLMDMLLQRGMAPFANDTRRPQ